MADDQNNTSNRRDNERIPFETNVHIEFEKFSGFISEYSVNISEGGMFIKSDNPAPVGTILSFEFKLKDNFTLIQGLGEVSWIREKARSPEDPAGMGVKFREVSTQSKQLISSMITNHINKGGKVFDLEGGMDKTKTLAFFDAGETTIDQSYVPENTEVHDKSNLEALFDVPLSHQEEEVLFQPAQPGDSTKKDLEALFSMDSEQEDLISIPPKSKKHDPETREHTSPEVPMLRQENKRSLKALWIVLGLIISGAAGAFFFKDEISPLFKGTPLEFIYAWNQTVPQTSNQPIAIKEPDPASVDAPSQKATPLHENSSAPLDAIIDSQPEIQATPAVADSSTAAPQPSAPIAETPATTIVTAAPTPVEKMDDHERSSPSGNATKINRVFYENIQTGMILSIVLNRKMDSQNYGHLSIVEGAPREVIKITGLSEKFRYAKVPVSHPNILQVRVGNHAGKDGNEVHFVVDLKNPNFRISKIESTSNMIQAYFESK